MSTAEKIVSKIWDDLCGRSGFDLDCLEEDIQDEIKEAWLKIVKKETKEKA